MPAPLEVDIDELEGDAAVTSSDSSSSNCNPASTTSSSTTSSSQSHESLHKVGSNSLLNSKTFARMRSGDADSRERVVSRDREDNNSVTLVRPMIGERRGSRSGSNASLTYSMTGRTKSTSFNVDQYMNQIRDNNTINSVRNSLVQSRQTELGSDVMRMDENYQLTSSQRNLVVDGLTPLLQAARAGDLMLVNALIIQPGTDVLRRDPLYGQTALHLAIRGGHLGVVQALLMPHLANSIVNIADSRRNTALHLAAAKSRRITRLLLENGADPNIVNMRNQTPLGVHILTTTKDDPITTELLLQHNANPNAPIDRSTILHVALDKQLFQIATRLVRHGARLDMKDEGGKMVFDKVEPVVLKMLLSKVAYPPVWVPDTERKDCMTCSKRFSSLGARRHHCRFCGRLVCSSCSACTIKGHQLPFHSKEKKTKQNRKTLRVCKTCHEIFVEIVSNPNNATANENVNADTIMSSTDTMAS